MTVIGVPEVRGAASTKGRRAASAEDRSMRCMSGLFLGSGGVAYGRKKDADTQISLQIGEEYGCVRMY